MKKSVVICGIATTGLPRLTAAESDALLKKAAAGDKQAREELIIGNLRLVLSLMQRFYAKRGDTDDVFQAGTLGLIKAVDRFDVSLGVCFSTYAVPMILGEMKKVFREENSLKVPRSVRDTAYRALKTREKLEKMGEEADFDRIAEVMGVAASSVTDAFNSMSAAVSLYEPVFRSDGDDLLLMDQILDEEKDEDDALKKIDLKKALALLPEREKTIISLRYFSGRTQTEISKIIGVSQAQISRLEKNALTLLKKKVAVS